MSIKTTTLETSKMLKEAGFRQDTYFRWSKPFDVNVNFTGDELEVEAFNWLEYHDMQKSIICSAPTTDELLEELPIGGEWTGHYRHFAMWPHSKNNWQCAYVLPEGSGYFGWQEDINPVEVGAKMWRWLNKEGLLPKRGKEDAGN